MEESCRSGPSGRADASLQCFSVTQAKKMYFCQNSECKSSRNLEIYFAIRHSYRRNNPHTKRNLLFLKKYKFREPDLDSYVISSNSFIHFKLNKFYKHFYLKRTPERDELGRLVLVHFGCPRHCSPFVSSLSGI